MENPEKFNNKKDIAKVESTAYIQSMTLRELTDYTIEYLATGKGIAIPTGIISCKTRSLLVVSEWFIIKKRYLSPSELKTLISEDQFKNIVTKQLCNAVTYSVRGVVDGDLKNRDAWVVKSYHCLMSLLDDMRSGSIINLIKKSQTGSMFFLFVEDLNENIEPLLELPLKK